MINAYKEGKDLYAMIASKVYHNNYEDNLEHYPDGSIYEDGKKRRASMKGLLLGMLYGMGTASIAEMIKGTEEEAKELQESFFNEFPKVKKWIDDNIKNAKKCGYVEDWYGRRRRLPDIMLPPYEVKYKDDKKNNVATFNPFLYCADRKIDDKVISKYKAACNKIKSYKDYKDVKEQASKEGVDIISNTSFIAQAERQTTNSRVQGGAATMTKVAMIKIHNDEILNKLGFKMLIGVHDELIGECPREYAEEVADRLSYVMRTCIEDYCEVPFKCDADIATNWYMNEYQSEVTKEYKELLNTGLSQEAALNKIYDKHSESTKEVLDGFLLK